jgi:putative endonuclease
LEWNVRFYKKKRHPERSRRATHRKIIMSLYLYILKCSDNSYYTGVTNDLEKRIIQHQIGLKMDCYTFHKRPGSLVFSEIFIDKRLCIEWEKKLKKWTRKKKEALINGKYDDLKQLSECKNETHFSNYIKTESDRRTSTPLSMTIKEILNDSL